MLGRRNRPGISSIHSADSGLEFKLQTERQRADFERRTAQEITYELPE